MDGARVLLDYYDPDYKAPAGKFQAQVIKTMNHLTDV